MQTENSREQSLKQAKEFYTDHLNGLYSHINTAIPAEYSVGTPEVFSSVVSDSSVLIVSGTDIFAGAADEAAVTAAAEQAEIMLISPAACNLVDYLGEAALSIADDESSAAVNEAVSAVKTEISQAADMEALYQAVLSAESRIFGCLSADIADTSEKPQIIPILYRDSEQRIWLRIISSVPFPGLADRSTGFSLQLLLDKGDVFQVSADSISNYDSIVYDGAYSVRFDLGSLITDMTAEEYFAGRNRAVFSMFTLDNSAGFTHDFYRMSLSDVTTVNGSEAYLTLLQIIAAYAN